MSKPSLPFLAVITTATIVIGYLFLQVRAERDAAAQLLEHVAQLEGAVQSPGSGAQATTMGDQSSPSAGPEAHEALPTAPVASSSQSVTISRPLFSPAIREELGLTEQDGEQFIQLLRSGGTQADFVALIGAARYEQYQVMQRRSAREQWIGQLWTSLADTRHPLTDAQAAQLDLLLDAEQRRRAEDEQTRPRPTDPRAPGFLRSRSLCCRVSWTFR